MMRLSGLIILLFPIVGLSQTSEGKVWTELGVGGEIVKNLDWGVELTNRFGSYGLETFFPQASLKYKLNKYVRFSGDYRTIFDRQLNGTYSNAHRVNFNVEGRYQVDRLYLKLRGRYQYSFDRFVASEFYEPEFDQAIRGKLEVKYDVNDFILTPIVSGEVFYNPQFGPFGNQINKLRITGGFELDLNSNHEVSFGYIYDTRINLTNPRNRHILSLGYGYTIKEKKKKKKKD
jgi:hypothetical protein